MSQDSQTLAVNEIFHSLQGESTWAGTPCAFVRLAGCNLSCAWCDTRYAMDEPGRTLTIGMIRAAIHPCAAPLVEITGGEPLLQEGTPELAALLLREGYEVLVETNGSVDISVLPYPVARIMDIKTPSSGMTERNRWANLAHLRRGDEVKFVIADPEDYLWAKDVVTGSEYPGDKVATLFSPAWGRVEADELVEWMLRDRLDVRLNLQLHRIIWPKVERGV